MTIKFKTEREKQGGFKNMKTIIKNKNYTIEFNKLESLIIKDKEGNILYQKNANIGNVAFDDNGCPLWFMQDPETRATVIYKYINNEVVLLDMDTH